MSISPSNKDPDFFDKPLGLNSDANPTTGSWSQDNTSTGIGSAASYNANAGSLTLNSGSVSGNSTTYLSDIQPGETLHFSFQLSLSPPFSGNYNRLSYYLTYTNAQGKQETAYIPIDVTKSPNTISFTIPSDMSPGTPFGFTLHNEKDWGSTPESVTFSNMQFTTEPSPLHPTDPVAAWVKDIENSNNPSVQGSLSKIEDQTSSLLEGIKSLYQTYESLRSSYVSNPTQDGYQQLQSALNSLQSAISAVTASSLQTIYAQFLTSGILEPTLQPLDALFTGSSSQMQEIWEYMAQQESTIFNSNLPKIDPLPAPPIPLPSANGGSGLSNQQECSALMANSSVQDLFNIMNGKTGQDATMAADYTDLQNAKNQYRQALQSGASPSVLNADQANITSASQKMLQYLVNAVVAIIASSPAGSSVASIATDYSSGQSAEFLSHVEMLCSMMIQPSQSPGNPVAPNIPSQNYVPPAQISPDNLINNNPNSWVFNHGTTGNWNPNQTGDSPSGDQNCIVIDNSNAKGSDYYERHQDIATGSSKAGDQYLIAAYVQGPISDGQGDFLPAGITVSGDINFNGVMYSPQSYDDSAGTNQWHLVYFVVTADKPNANLEISLNAPAGGIAKFSNLQVIPIGDGNSPNQIQSIATGMYPPPSIAGNPGLGPFPQHQSTYNPGDNLINWPPSQWQNAPSKDGYPYWSEFGGGTGSTLVNSGNAKESIQITPTADTNASTTTASQALLPPSAGYDYSCQITIPNPVGNTFPGLDIIGIDYSTSPPTRVVLGHWDPKNSAGATLSPPLTNPMTPGTYSLSYTIPAGAMKNAFQISTEWSAYKGTGPFSITSPNLTPSNAEAYSEINASNPYDTSRSIYNSQNSTYSASWNFANDTTEGDGAMSDWGVSLVGNDISNPQAGNVSYIPGKGIVLNDTVSPNGSISDAGIQSSFMTAPGQPFKITTNIQFNTPNSPNKPVFALWTYGEAQKGDSSGLSHKSAGGGDTDNECDFELCPPNAQYPNGYFRAVTYAGWDAGGKPHSFINIPLQPGCNLWDGNPHSLSLSVNPLTDGNCSVTWTVTGGNGAETQYTYSSSPEEPGYPLGNSSTYLKIATEQPYGWPGFEKHPGSSSFTISSMQYTQDPLPSGVDPSTLPPVSDSDYSYYMPGKGFAYTPFPSNFFDPENEYTPTD